MAGIVNRIDELIGNTPLLRLNAIERKEGAKAAIIAKLESFNPAGSSKDRIAREIIEAAEREGKLKPGGTIIEGTSGNTGIALAAIGAAKGYKVILTMPDNMSQERIKIAQGYGAEIILTPAEELQAGSNKKAAEIQAATENSILVGQGGNPNNPAAHYKTTGPEIWRDTEGKVDIYVATVGTGGTISGAGKYLREKNPDLYIVAVEPARCAVLNGGEPGIHKIQGIGSGAIAPVTDVSLFNEVIDVTDEQAFEYARKASREEGVFVGISSGAALYAAVQLAKRPENEGKNIVVVLPDTAERYITTELFD